MTDDSKETKPTPVEPDAPQAAPSEPPASADQGLADALSPADAEVALLTARVAELEGEKTDLIDRLLRAQADMDNFRKRAEREREETAKYAISKFARDVVAVADNFERAMAAVAPEALADNPALAALLDGVRMTEREFLNALERHGVARMSPKGAPFDPNVHQAVMEQHDTAVPAGTVLQVYQAGYMIEDRCLRPAMVVVSRGGPKTPKPAPAAAGETAAAAPAAAEPGAEPAAEATPPEGAAAAPTSEAPTGAAAPSPESDVAAVQGVASTEAPAATDRDPGETSPG